MRACLVLAVLVCVVASAYSDLVCGTDYCKKNPCTEDVNKSSCKIPAVYKAAHSGKCACCPACVTMLSEGEPCKIYSKELGETPSAVCREPLKCQKGACTKVAPRK